MTIEQKVSRHKTVKEYLEFGGGNMMWAWWREDCERKTWWVRLEDGTYQCQCRGGAA